MAKLNVGQPVLIHYASGTVHKDRIKQVYANGRFAIRGKVGSWYIEQDNLARPWNDPGFHAMVAEIVE